jgi:hypothetical protein
MSRFDYYTIQNRSDEDYPRWCVYGWGTYPSHSVLAGQAMKCFLDSYDSYEEALAEHPEAHLSGEFTEPQVCLNHLSDEGDY